ncbi:MAG: glycosyltransferase family 4 protein [Candidatus Eremiobacteraeota bacterium]|nr:glycosyltransferase family 4 protein [Candidatus Eremiobacteraeota bacterium]MCW5868688.1 glycosyltransferase family 4 protein [Candidatus Eremiobacteraeota bacterium]
MHILLTNENRGRGGAERFTVQLGRRLRGAGLKVTLACRADSWLAGQELNSVHLPFRGEIDPASYLAAHQKLVPLQPDVIHCQASRDLALFGSVRRLFLKKTRLLKSEHSFLDSAGSAWLRWCYRQCQAVIPVSQALRRQMSEILPFYLPYQVIHNAMDLPDLEQPIPEPMRRHRWLGYVGALLPSKGVGDVLRASAPLLRRHSDLRLLLAGEGPEAESLKKLAVELEVAEQVWMPGHVADPLPYLAGLQVLLQASPRETFSLVAMEAMSLQVPVVAYLRDGLPEVVEDGQTGWLCSELDPQKLSARVAYYLGNEELRRAHGHNGRLRVQSLFSWDIILPQWLRLYAGEPL